MKILVFCGSGRAHSNTDHLLKQVAQGAMDNNHEIVSYNLDQLSFKGCKGCGACKASGTCSRIDAMTPIYQELYDCDAVVVGSPIYMGDITGQTRLFFDRWYALKNRDFSRRILDDKKGALIIVQGAQDAASYQSCLNKWMRFLSSYGFITPIEHTIIAAGIGPAGQISNHPDLMKKAYRIGHNL